MLVHLSRSLISVGIELTPTARKLAPLPAQTRRRRNFDAPQDNSKGPSFTPPEPHLAPRSPRVSTPAPATVASKLLSKMASRSARSLPSVVSLVDTPVA
ncbi:hypothetical protein GN958_ATG03321 [Phytophthora infestans]|uniref:Uncharacterized protein n=1 Tax=Phytophthora infestans TaxID=4787 RepID=A0A8S9V8C8_PHYIN|nr:hypothetical protein GN958_ATG03321 [Phytophthora infestans]